jgi:hypothetical protein
MIPEIHTALENLDIDYTSHKMTDLQFGNSAHYTAEIGDYTYYDRRQVLCIGDYPNNRRQFILIGDYIKPIGDYPNNQRQIMPIVDYTRAIGDYCITTVLRL